MRSLVLLWGCLVFPGYEALKCPKEISGFEGDTVSLKCTYEAKLQEHRKYWCKQGGILVSRCSSTIYTRNEQKVTKDRVSIRDNPRELSVTITVRSLMLQDAGKYWCGIDRLGFDEAFQVTLIVFPASPDLRPTVTTAKQGKTRAEVPVVIGATPASSTGTSPSPGTSPYAGSFPHTATSPHAGSSRPVIWLPTTPKDSSLVPRRSSSKPRVSIPMVRMLTPVLVLLSLLVAAGVIGISSHILQWRKKAWQVTETSKNETFDLPTSHLGNGWADDAMLNLAAPPGPLSSSTLSDGPCTEEIQTTEEAFSSQHPKEEVVVVPPQQMSEEELRFSEFISV